MFIFIKEQVKLYWVVTTDHGEDWFIFAESAGQARSYHEDCEGYGKGDARARLIVSNVTVKEFMNGTPPCYARFEDLYQIGQNAGTIAGRRKGRLNGAIFRDGILEAIIELGRNQPTVTMQENSKLQLNEATSLPPGAGSGITADPARLMTSANFCAPPPLR